MELPKELRDMDGGTVDVREVYKKVRAYYVKKYSLDSNKALNRRKLERDYKFGERN